MNRFGRWMVRRGFPGSVARWAAKMFIYLRLQNPTHGEKSLFELMIRSRYALMPSDAKLSRLLAGLPAMSGLRDLVRHILVVESSAIEAGPDSFKIMLQIAVEELYRKGLTDEDVWGRQSPAEIAIELADDFRTLRGHFPKAFMGEIYGALVTLRYGERHLKQHIQAELLRKAPFMDGLMELVVAVLIAESLVDRDSIETVGAEVADTMSARGLMPEELFGRSAPSIIGGSAN